MNRSGRMCTPPLCPQMRRYARWSAILLTRAFSGNLDKFVMQAVAAKRATPQELADVRRLLKEYERSLK